MAEYIICSCGQISEFMCKSCPNVICFCVVHMVSHLKETAHPVQPIDQVYIQEYLKKLAKIQIQTTIKEIIINTEILISDIISISNTFIKQLNEMNLNYITSDHLKFIRFQREKITQISKEARVIIEELKNPKADKTFHHNKNNSSFNHEQPSNCENFDYSYRSGFSTIEPSSHNEKPTHIPRSYSTVHDYQSSTVISSESNPPLLPRPPSHSTLSLLHPSNGTYADVVNSTVPVDTYSNLLAFPHSSFNVKSNESSQNLYLDDRIKMNSSVQKDLKGSEGLKAPRLLNKKDPIFNEVGNKHPHDSYDFEDERKCGGNKCFIF